ncbi:MAG: hypothetical protein NTX50_23730 [Candidatus Sumerlaeota bacterium]|nr:hypothetical protein [Candidatus Sumerlaeota bacterium]
MKALMEMKAARISIFAVALAIALSLPGQAAEQSIVLKGGRHQIAFSPENGAILSVSDGVSSVAIFRSGEPGLWQLRFRDGGLLCAADFKSASGARRFDLQRDAGAQSLQLTYRAPEAIVIVTVKAHDSGFDFQSQITSIRSTSSTASTRSTRSTLSTPFTASTASTILEFVLPARLRFDPDFVRRFVSPLNPHRGVGAAFNAAFFKSQPPEKPSSWRNVNPGPAGYQRLFGSGLRMLDMNAPAVKLQVTAEGREWFGPDLSARLTKASARVCRPSLPAQVDLTLIGSENGPFFSASHLGGKGSLWRFGAMVDESVGALVVDSVAAVIAKLAKAPAAGKKLGLVCLLNGPSQGGGCEVAIQTWRARFEQLAKAGGLELIEFASPEAMVAAAQGGDFLAILNPYGEGLPTPAKSTLRDTVDAIGRYVRQGGNWFEVGGYTFYAALQPSRFLKYESPYPPLFSDFVHLDSAAGKASLYRIQPRSWKPWAGAQTPQDIFVPGRLAFAGDEQGGWFERAFAAYIAPGQTWTAPVVRLALGSGAEENLRAYCDANGITRSLREKMPPDVFEKFRRAVLIKYDGSARDMMASLDKLPAPALLHYSDYLKGGFDKEYPDHLPPRPSFGTPQELRAFHDRAHALGHLVMPYTNPTWWCDHPRGPTFERAGEAPLLIKLDGKTSHERYGNNDGWTICYWHPAVRAANTQTLRQFTDEYPVDILFQDQCGARGWAYDLNPASPTPLAYIEGMLSLVEEECAVKPLSTEDGWDRVVNAEAQLCGFTFALGPGRKAAFAPELKTIYHPSTWQLYPFAQQVAHDKCAMLHHDLGKFVSDRPSLSWTLGLGFAMSCRINARALNEAGPREWIRWVDRIQKSVCARYVGEPVAAFDHQQGGESSGDDGVIRAAYGPVRLVANLSPAPRREEERELAGYGFYATAPGMIAGNLRNVAGMDLGEEGIGFVTEGDAKRAEIWIYAPAGFECAVELPKGFSGEATVTFDGEPARLVAVQGAIRLKIPASSASAAPPNAPAAKSLKRLWHAQVAKR